MNEMVISVARYNSLVHRLIILETELNGLFDILILYGNAGARGEDSPEYREHYNNLCRLMNKEELIEE